jgi:hypothetical protein
MENTGLLPNFARTSSSGILFSTLTYLLMDVSGTFAVFEAS